MSKKPSRNDPCPCGSGKKYKQCCLKNETVKATYTPSGKRKFKAKVVGTGNAAQGLFGRMSAQPQHSGENTLEKLKSRMDGKKEEKPPGKDVPLKEAPAEKEPPSNTPPKKIKKIKTKPKNVESFNKTEENYQEDVKEAVLENREEIKRPRFKKIPSKRPGEDFKPTDHDFEVDKK
ncbi:MAG: SEC-C domain-containing protein [Chlamydiales bacterium]|nr:SEC-C domain-containing protein [Chlamydiales bacterium]